MRICCTVFEQRGARRVSPVAQNQRGRPETGVVGVVRLSLNDLAVAVVNKEAGRLTKIPGVGKKTAERLLLELQGKFSVTGGGSAQGAVAASSGSDIVNALLGLDYSEKEADWAARQLSENVNISDGIRQAFKVLSKA